MSDAELRTTHEHSSYHRDELARSIQAGCFNCLAVFPAAAVVEWIDSKIVGDPGETALCPLCGIDSVLPDALVTITPQMLVEMHRYWFGGARSIEL